MYQKSTCLRKIVRFLRSTLVPIKGHPLGEPPRYNDMPCKDNTVFNPDAAVFPPHYSRERACGKPSAQQTELQEELFDLWRKVWLGLYETYDNSASCHIPFHYDRLEALYYGTGMTEQADLNHLGTLRRWFPSWRPSNGVAAMKIFEHMSVQNLRSMLEVLKAYESEIENLTKIYAILRAAQLELGQLLHPQVRALQILVKAFWPLLNRWGKDSEHTTSGWMC
ncbi:hypothetical protein N7470_004343 [Penicillium chermesinum]|nr:hypothetical protein N7470_004343 [Penicillium chermesinum]